MIFVADREQFAAQRRAVLTRGDDDLSPAVDDALAQWGQERWWAPITEAAGRLFDITAEAEGVRDPATVAGARDDFTEGMGERLAETSEPGPDRPAQSARITAWVSTATVNAATMAAAAADEDEVNLEWVTMHDPLVRAAHDDADGQSVPAGSTFSVAGYDLHYPGEPVGPPSVWINCRCVVRPGPGGNMAASVNSGLLTIPDAVHAGTPEGNTQFVEELATAMAEPIADDEIDPDAPVITDDDLDMDVPFYGVALPEGLPTGDRRKFAVGSVRYRDLPLPFRAQPADIGGHDGAVTIGRIDNIWRDEASGLIKYEGVFARTPQAEEYIAMNADRMRRGVSVDVDDATAEVQNEDGSLFDEETWQQGDPQPFTVVTDGRIAAITAVDIPAFQEAFVAIGTWADHPTDDNSDPVDSVAVEAACTECEVAALLANMPPEHLAQFEAQYGSANDEMLGFEFEVDDGTKYRLDSVGLHVFAPGTHDGPGWITHPRATERIRRYWVRGKGAAKIRWGQPGDFNRCRRQLVKYVKNPDWLAGLCANMHKEAIKLWPGQEGGKRKHSIEGDPADAFTLTAAIESDRLPAAWFKDPKFAKAQPVTVDEDGHIYGHLALWSTCHIGIDKVCTSAPTSLSRYAYFTTGAVLTDEGQVPVGNITMDTGHAGMSLRARPAMAHYDNTGSVAADVAAGEDQFGIWINGAVRSTLSKEQVHALRASTLSGDWRQVGRNLELVAALAVNVPGFPIPRTALAASGGEQISLVASGVVAPATGEAEVEPDPAISAERAARANAAFKALRAARLAAVQSTFSQ